MERWGGGLAKWLFYYITLFSKSDHDGGGGSKIPKNLTTLFVDDPIYDMNYPFNSDKFKGL